MIVLNSPVARGVAGRNHGARPCRAVWLTVAFAVLGTACTGGPREELDASRKGAEPTTVEQRRAVVEKEGMPNSPRRAPSTQLEEGTGEVPPQLLELFKDDLARRALVQPEAIKVLSATERQWPDGAMGCPQPGQMYTQVIVPGYRALLQAGGETYAYHSDLRGHFIVCAGGRSLSPVKEQMKAPPPAA